MKMPTLELPTLEMPTMEMPRAGEAETTLNGPSPSRKLFGHFQYLTKSGGTLEKSQAEILSQHPESWTRFN
ncbi:hypothetical protein L1887_39157 [Cichorium endivia]|nr:hypothetical protein L1887_39157 [Cichorium endivia]